MASPFNVFRRNQRLMLVVVGLLAMVSFVILSPLAMYSGGGSGRVEDPVVVETNFGNLHRSELQNTVFMRNIVRQFLADLMVARIRSQMDRMEPNQAAMYAQYANQIIENTLNEVLVTFFDQPYKDAATMLVLARRAEALGINFSDASITEYLRTHISGDQTRDTLAKVLNQIRVEGRPISQERLLNALRRELLAARLVQMFGTSLRAPPPAQNWEYFLKLNQQATIEAIGLRVADFLNEVKENPTEEQLRGYYDQYKDRIPLPGSPEPGFKQPQLAKFQYLTADYDTFVKDAESKVTDEEVKKYYDEHKKDFPATKLPSFDTKSSGAAPGEDSGGPAPSSVPKPEPKSDVEPDPAPSAEHAPDKSPADSPKSPAKSSADEIKPDATPVNRPEAQPKATPSAPPAGEQPKQTGEAERKQSSLAPVPSGRERHRRFKLVSAPKSRDEASGKAADTAPSKPAPKASDSGNREQAASAAKDDEKSHSGPALAAPRGGEAATATPSPDSKKDDTQAPTPQKGKADAGKADAGKAATDAPAKKEPEYEPFEKVRSDIRTMLARTRAREAINTGLEKISNQMVRYSREFAVYQARKEKDSGLKPPATLDLEKLGTEGGFKLKETTLISRFDARLGTDLGKSFVFGEQRTVPLIEVAYANDSERFRPVRSQDQEGNEYLSWKVDGKPEAVLPLTQIRRDVVRAWKMIRARDLAHKKASQLAAEARAAKKPLRDVFGKKYDVITAGPFTWLTRGTAGNPNSMPRISEVSNVDDAGNEFMEAVFGLTTGQLTTATNQPKTTEYVIRLTDLAPRLEVLRSEFAQADPRTYMLVAVEDQRQMISTWINDLNKQAGVRWLEEPASLSR